MRLEAATGLTHLAFQQDFAAKIVADNLHGLLDHNDAAIGPALVTPTRRPHRAYAIGTLKPILAGCLPRIRHCLDRLAAALDVIAWTLPRPTRPGLSASPANETAFLLRLQAMPPIDAAGLKFGALVCAGPQSLACYE